jgi:hypothetical protein
VRSGIKADCGGGQSNPKSRRYINELIAGVNEKIAARSSGLKRTKLPKIAERQQGPAAAPE